MSNIYLKAIIDSQVEGRSLLCLEKLSPGQFLESSNSHRYHWISKRLVAA